ncbi:MAG: DUF72 domain-containing protein [Bacteroidetes bacterium]|nr:MAG: DUF72 domain-containing protein [Bacteroidota bacterium]
MKKLSEPREYLKNFMDAIEPLGEKTSCILWQLPGKLHVNPGKLDHFCSLLGSDHIHVLEFRHPSWFSGAVEKIIEGYKNIVICSLSAPGDLPEDLYVNRGIAYLRFHGKKDWYRYNYSDHELDNWSGKVKNAGVRQLYAYFNNDVDAHAPANALAFAKKVAEDPG